MSHSFPITEKVSGRSMEKNELPPLKKSTKKRNVLGTVRGRTGEIKDGLFLLGEMKVENALDKKAESAKI